MYTLSIENTKGEALQLSQNPKYSITSITGLNPPTANINTAVNASFDGSTFKSSRLNNRNIVITMAIEGNAEKNRIDLYRYVKVKQGIKVHFKNDTRDVFINGYVETLECGIFEQREMVQISIICPSPYFEDVNPSVDNFSTALPLFEFPFSIESSGVAISELRLNSEVNVINSSDIDTGMIIEFKATGEVVNPVIFNLSDNSFMKLNLTMQQGDTVIINTNKGEKSVLQHLGGATVNILNKLDAASTWLQLESGDNIMLFTADTGAEYLSCLIYHSSLYEGV